MDYILFWIVVCLAIASINSQKSNTGKICGGKDQWPCVTGSQCIEHEAVCDGNVDCADGTDETFHECSNRKCPNYTFRCAYGACVDGDSACDGKNDCADQSDELLPRCKGVISSPKSHNCTVLQFACLNGRQCVDLDKHCDGTKDCFDASDETITQCGNVNCPAFAFRCSYGACIDGDKSCDKSKDCYDGSDEFAPECKVDGAPPRPGPTTVTAFNETIGSPCFLPPFPVNGFWTSVCKKGDTKCAGAPEGTQVSHSAKVIYSCEEGFSVLGSRVKTCYNGAWYPLEETTCSDHCLLPHSDKLITSCSINSNWVSCKKLLPPGASVRFKCRDATYFKVVELQNSKLECVGGTWKPNYPENICQPICGRSVNATASLFLSGASAADRSMFPWHVGIYSPNKGGKMTLDCGGSLISDKMVLTAAHCFRLYNADTRSLDDADLSKMKVGLGKFYSNFKDDRDTDAQYSDIARVENHPEYTGPKDNYGSDISIAIFVNPVIFTVAIQPICLDLAGDNEDDQLVPGRNGLVPGWGETEESSLSENLMVAKIPYVSNKECLTNTELYNFVTKDKMCGGEIKEGAAGTCMGDSGGGYVFFDDTTKSFYLRGIVSAGNKYCQGEDYSLFTKVSKHQAFLNRIIN